MSQIQTIWSLELLHEYYSNNKCKHLSFSPTLNTQQKLRGLDWLLRREENSLEILAPAETSNIKDPLYFNMYVRNTDFFHFTQIEKEPDEVLWVKCEGNGLILTSKKITGRILKYSIDSSEVIDLTIKNGKGEEVGKVQGIVREESQEFKFDLAGNPQGTYGLRFERNGKSILDDEIYYGESLKSGSLLGVIEVLSTQIDPPIRLQHQFKSTKSSWKFYFVLGKEEDGILLLKDELKKAQSNRYSEIAFNFCERPVDHAIDGNFTKCFETGAIDESDTFIPQFIPSYEENKTSISLMRYPIEAEKDRAESWDSKYKKSYSKSKKRRDDDDDDDDDFDSEYFVYRCLDSGSWDEKLKQHRFSKGSKWYKEYRLRKQGRKLMDNVQNPSLKQLKKEVYIYL